MRRKPTRTPSTLSNQFGQTLKELRLKRGLTQEQLGFEANVDRSFVAKLETGKISPSLDTINTLTKGLGMSITDLVRILEENLEKAEHAKESSTERSS